LETEALIPWALELTSITETGCGFGFLERMLSLNSESVFIAISVLLSEASAISILEGEGILNLLCHDLFSEVSISIVVADNFDKLLLIHTSPEGKPPDSICSGCKGDRDPAKDENGDKGVSLRCSMFVDEGAGEKIFRKGLGENIETEAPCKLDSSDGWIGVMLSLKMEVGEIDANNKGSIKTEPWGSISNLLSFIGEEVGDTESVSHSKSGSSFLVFCPFFS